MPAMENDIDVRRHLAGLLRQEDLVDAFIDWFHPANWLIERYGTEEDYDLATRIEHRLFEMMGGYIDDAELIEGLREDADEFGVTWREPTVVGSSRLAS